jgi:hypothetical protein
VTINDRREIGRETWLKEGLWFDVRANAIFDIRQNVGFGSSVVKLWDEITVREAAEPSEQTKKLDASPSALSAEEEIEAAIDAAAEVLTKARAGCESA